MVQLDHAHSRFPAFHFKFGCLNDNTGGLFWVLFYSFLNFWLLSILNEQHSKELSEALKKQRKSEMVSKNKSHTTTSWRQFLW